MQFTVIYDDSVLYPPELRDFLLELALTDLFRAHWTEDIHAAWLARAVLEKPDKREALERTRDLMDRAVRGSVLTGYRKFMGSVQLPVQFDDKRHVLAAALASGAQVIVTYHPEFFPPDVLAAQEVDVEAQHPDIFVGHLLSKNARAVCAALEAVRKRLNKPPHNRKQHLKLLEEKSELYESVKVIAAELEGFEE